MAAVAPVDPGTSVPTPECNSSVGGQEISIAMVSSEMGVRLGNLTGQVGKKLKALYAFRYGEVSASNLPKRSTVYRGKPYNENMYYSRDRDLVEQAIDHGYGY